MKESMYWFQDRNIPDVMVVNDRETLNYSSRK